MWPYSMLYKLICYKQTEPVSFVNSGRIHHHYVLEEEPLSTVYRETYVPVSIDVSHVFIVE